MDARLHTPDLRRASLAAILLLSLLGTLGACSDDATDEDSLSLHLFTTNGVQIAPVAGLEQIRVTAVDHARNEVLAQESFAYGDGKGTLGGVTYAEDLQVVIEGLDALGNAVLRGASSPFAATRDGKIEPPPIFMSPVESFSPATALTEFGGALQPQEVRFQVARPRAGHAVVTLEGGILLITGGAEVTTGAGIAADGLPDGYKIASNGVLDTVELYDPVSGLFFERPPMRIPRAFHTTTVLADGRVLVVGGVAIIEKDGGDVVETLASAEIFDPRRPNEPWELVAGQSKGLTDSRAWHTATLRRADGRVVVIGGRTIAEGASSVLGTAEIFNPDTDRFEFNPGDEPIAMEQPRAGHTAELLLTGRGAGKSIIVIGGQNDQGVLRSTEVLRVVGQDARSSFDLGPAMNVGRAGHTSITASPAGGRLIVVAGGVDSDGAPLDGVEVLDVESGEFDLMARLSKARAWGEMVELAQTGDLVVIGGLGATGDPVAAPDRLAYNPVDSSYTSVPVEARMLAARAMLRAVRLDNGLVLVTGGVDDSGDSLDTAEFYNVDDGEPGLSWELPSTDGDDDGFLQ